MDSLCLTVSAVAAITTGSSMETEVHANERAGVQEGAERLTRPELNRENSRASNERQRMAAGAKPGTTIPPYHHTTTVWPYVYACLVGRVWSNAAGTRVLGSRRCNVTEIRDGVVWQCQKNVPPSRVKKGERTCGKTHSFTGL